jgi:hypothetical protein
VPDYGRLSVMTTTEATSAPHAIAHHLDAYRPDGSPARTGGMAGDLGADFSPQYHPGGTLAAAQARAELLFAEYAQVASVVIRESHQRHEGGMWREGPVVEVITRGDRPGPRYVVEPLGNGSWRVVGPHAWGQYGDRMAAESAAFRLMDTTAAHLTSPVR